MEVYEPLGPVRAQSYLLQMMRYPVRLSSACLDATQIIVNPCGLSCLQRECLIESAMAEIGRASSTKRTLPAPINLNIRAEHCSMCEAINY